MQRIYMNSVSLKKIETKYEPKERLHKLMDTLGVPG